MTKDHKIIQFPPNTPMTPGELYHSLLPQMKYDELSYVHGSISSGVAALNPNWNVKDRILNNRLFALKVVDALQDRCLLPPGKTIVAHMIGPRDHQEGKDRLTPWTESEFLVFWMAVMARFPSGDDVDLLYHHTHREGRVDMSVFNNYDAPFDERRKEYEKFTTIALEDIDACSTGKISAIYTTPGSTDSLGSMMERTVAQHLDVPLLDIHIDREQSLKTKQPFIDQLLFQWLLDHPEHWDRVFTNLDLPIDVSPVSSGVAV